MITTDDRAPVQAATQPASDQGARLLSELDRLLREPGCPACRYVNETERTFFSWFQIDSFSSPDVQAQLRAGLGMCPAHSRRLVEELGEGHVMTTVVRQALAGALQVVSAEMQAGMCPACEAAAVGSRRACQLVLDGLRDPAVNRRYSEHGGMCLEHVLQALPVAGPSDVKVLADRLLGGLYEEVGPTLLGVLGGSDDDAPRRALWRGRLPELPQRGSTVDWLRDVIEIEACPVCLSAAAAERDYFDWFSSRSAANDPSLRSDPGEFCRGHLHDVAAVDTGSASGLAIEHKRATRTAHLERFLARLSQLPAPGRRARRSKPDGFDQVRTELLACSYCAACHARDGIERSRLDLVAASLSLAPIRERYERGHGLCLRHAVQMSDSPAARVAKRHLDGRLAVLAWEVEEVARKYAWAYRHETSGPEHDAWIRALAQIDGRVFVGAPAPAGHPPGTPEAE